MAYTKKTWQDRVVEHPARRKLTSLGNDVYDVTRNEGTITYPGDAFNAQNMNDLETRIETAINSAGHTKEQLVNMIYPTGSIYMSVNSTSPQTLFGGTWVRLKDRFLLGAGDTYSNGATGGKATHTLIPSEMPTHTHTSNVGVRTIYAGSGFSGYGLKQANGDGGGSTTLSGTSGSAGSGNAHNNMPPYLVVYMWKRTA